MGASGVQVACVKVFGVGVILILISVLVEAPLGVVYAVVALPAGAAAVFACAGIVKLWCLFRARS